VNRLVLFAVLLSGSICFAYDSQCRPDTGGFGNGDYEASICAKAPECGDGVNMTRGIMVGEHAKITRDAMRYLGIPEAIIGENAIPTYYAPNRAVPTQPGLATQEPATIALMQVQVSRKTVIPELAQLPDASYGLGDYLLGNEHCLASYIPRGTFDDVQACHSFTSHMGAVNSTHFSPQNHAVYTLYHQLALTTAKRCVAMKAAFDNASKSATHPLYATNDDSIADCEREALAMQAIASHFLEDAWSSGHMWERWGAPDFLAAPEDRINALVTGSVSGLIHGWRALAGSYPLVREIKDDQLCMPGPWPKETDFVQWTYPPTSGVVWSGGLQAGGGDGYLLDCPTEPGKMHVDWRLETEPLLAMQYNTMRECVGNGFAEVYDAGPQTQGPRSGGPAIFLTTGSQDPRCWEQRVTNKSLMLGVGVSGIRSFSQTATFYSSLVTLIKYGANTETVHQFRPVKTQLNADMPKIVGTIAWYAKHSPDTTEASTLPENAAQLLGQVANRFGVKQVEAGLPYLENQDVSKWTALSSVACRRDDDCAYGSYCTAAPDGASGSCQRPEHAVLSAYRTAERPKWCVYDKTSDLQTLINACASGTFDSSCDACVDVMLAHARNACDQASYQEKLPAIADAKTTWDHRSMCDVYADNNVQGSWAPYDSVYLRYDPRLPDDARRAAMELCKSGDQLKPESLQYAESGTTPPAQAQDIDATAVCYENINTCGVGFGEQWFRFRQSKQPQDREHKLRVVATPLTDANGHAHLATDKDLVLQVYQGPACTQKIAEVAPGQWYSWDIGANQTDEICVRVKAQSYLVWSSYRLEENGSCPLYAMDGDRTGSGQCQLRKIDPRNGQILGNRTVPCGDVKFDGSGSHLYRTAYASGQLFEIDTQTMADKPGPLWSGGDIRIGPGHRAEIVAYMPDPYVPNLGTVRYFGPMALPQALFQGFVWVGANNVTSDDNGFYDSYTFQDSSCGGPDCYFPGLARYDFGSGSITEPAWLVSLFCGPKPDGTYADGLGHCGLKPPGMWRPPISPVGTPDGTKMLVTLPLDQVGMVDLMTRTQLSASYLPYNAVGFSVLSPDDHTAAIRIEATDPVTRQQVAYLGLFDYSSGTLEPTLRLVDYGKPENFIAADFNNDGSKIYVSFHENGGPAVVVAFSVFTGQELYRVPVTSGISAMAVRR
jgi:hypothetical protein